jgi:predicted transcriptional regulator
VAQRTVGEQELQILRELVERGPGSVGELHGRFGEPRGLARSTVLTMMERLRRKGYLTRKPSAGVFVYAPRGGDAMLTGVIGRFVDRALGGSVAPFVAYLAERETISDHELMELERLVDRLRARRKAP